MNKSKSVYLDSNVFIYASLYKGETAEKAKEYLRKSADGKIDAVTASLTWDEVVYAFRRLAGEKESLRAGKVLLRMSFIRFVPVDFSVCEQAQRIAEKYGILPRDAIHAALALKYCKGRIISNDSDFDAVDGLKRTF